MEFFSGTTAVKIRGHLDKYLVADDDGETIRQSRNGSSHRAVWIVEPVENKGDTVRLKTCNGRYLTATDLPFLLGVTGKKVSQIVPGTLSVWMIQWEVIRDGFQVKLRSWCGTFLRANGGTPPWRNSITHDEPHVTSTKNWILWDVQAVQVPAGEAAFGHAWSMSSISSIGSGESEPASPVFTKKEVKSPRVPSNLKAIYSSGKFRSGMNFFHNAKAVRLCSHHNKYLIAKDDEESVTQDRNGSGKNARWTIELIDGLDSVILFKSCYGKYLTASTQPFLLGMAGQKVLQTQPSRLDPSVQWEPFREGTLVKFRTRDGQFMRANGSLPPLRNSVTCDIPRRTVTQDWILWNVDVVEILVQSAIDKPLSEPDLAHLDTPDSNSGSSSPASVKSNRFSRKEFEHKLSNDSAVDSPRKGEGRTIYYQLVDENGDGGDDTSTVKYSLTFKGSGVEELTRKLEEETGLEGLLVCTRSPLNGNLYPLRLQLPPNNSTMHVVVVLNSSTVAKEFAKKGLL